MSIIYLAVEDATVIPVILCGMHVDPKKSDLGVLSVARALGLAEVPGMHHPKEVLQCLHFDCHDAGATRCSHDGRKDGATASTAAAIGCDGCHSGGFTIISLGSNLGDPKNMSLEHKKRETAISKKNCLRLKNRKSVAGQFSQHRTLRGSLQARVERKRHQSFPLSS